MIDLIYLLVVVAWRTLLGGLVLLGAHEAAPAIFDSQTLPGLAQMVAAVLGVTLIAASWYAGRQLEGGASTGLLLWTVGAVGHMAAAWAVVSSVTGRNDWMAVAAAIAAATALGTHLGSIRLLRRTANTTALIGQAQPASTEPQAPQATLATRPRRSFADIGGMRDLKATILDAIEPFRRYASPKASPHDANGILLSGPPGNGKSLVAEAIAGELGFAFIKPSVADLTSKWINQGAEEVRKVFDEAIAAQPSVLFLDEFDAVARDRASGSAHAEDHKVVDTLLTEIDRIRRHRVVLIAATNHPDLLDKAITRDGRFDFRIEVPNPDLEARIEILRALSGKHGISVSQATVEKVAARMQNRSAAFIEGVVRRVRDAAAGDRTADLAAFKLADRATSRNASLIPASGDKLSNLYLPEAVAAQVRSITERLQNWEAIADQGGTPPKGVLFYGPPGTGKTNLTRAIARELGDWHLLNVNASEILADPRKFKAITEKASQHRPCIVFIDEADELLKERPYSANAAATNEILIAIDGAQAATPEVVFFAATNNLEVIDAAAKRGGRFEERVYLGRYSGVDLENLLARNLASRPACAMDSDVTPKAIADALGECAPADAIALLNRAINSTFVGDRRRPLTLRDIAESAKQLDTA